MGSTAARVDPAVARLQTDPVRFAARQERCAWVRAIVQLDLEKIHTDPGNAQTVSASCAVRPWNGAIGASRFQPALVMIHNERAATEAASLGLESAAQGRRNLNAGDGAASRGLESAWAGLGTGARVLASRRPGIESGRAVLRNSSAQVRFGARRKVSEPNEHSMR
jgi:hypothetical protein